MTNLENNYDYHRQRGNHAKIWNRTLMSRITISDTGTALPLHKGQDLRKNTNVAYKNWLAKKQITKLTASAPRIGIFKFLCFCLAAIVLLPLFFKDGQQRTTSNRRPPIV